MTSPTPSQAAALLVAAREAREAAYAPYSRFKVGAAVLGASGRVYVGCNVESCSYGLALCAERSAVGAAVCGGERRIEGLAVFTATERPTPPCGACRQVIAELGPTAWIISACPGAQETRSVAELLPDAFAAEHLRSVDDGR